MASTATPLASVLIMLAAVSYGLPFTHAADDFIAHTCKMTKNATLCVVVLSTDPKSAKARTEHDLARIALDIAVETAKNNSAAISHEGSKHKGTSEGVAWDVCVDAYFMAAMELEINARGSFSDKQYVDTLKVLFEGKDAGDTCEKAFKAIHKACPVADMDRQTAEHCSVAGDLVRLLLIIN